MWICDEGLEKEVLVIIHPEQLRNKVLSDLREAPKDTFRDRLQVQLKNQLCERRTLVCLIIVGLPAQQDFHEAILPTDPFQTAEVPAEGHTEANANDLQEHDSLESFRHWKQRDRVPWRHPSNKQKYITPAAP